jgi:hypothetical protein
MNSTPRFKSPALIELTADQPGDYPIVLTRDVKVIDAFAFAYDVEEGAFFQVDVLDTPTSPPVGLIGEVMLLDHTLVRANRLNAAKVLTRKGQILTFRRFGKACVTICLWVIPLPRPPGA